MLGKQGVHDTRRAEKLPRPLKAAATRSSGATGCVRCRLLFFDIAFVAVKSIDTSFVVEAQSSHSLFELALVAVAPQKSFQH
jgi:hypothetical protein